MLLPIDNYKILNFLNFSDVGTNAFHESSLFRQTRMFTKIFHSPLFFLSNDFSLKYSTFSPLFESDNNFFDSYLYGLKRQHNFVSSKSISNNFSTLLNLKNVEKFLNYNYNSQIKLNQTFIGNLSINFFKSKNTLSNLNTPLLNNAIFSFYNNEFVATLNKFLNYPSMFEIINNNSDKKKLKHPVLKIFSFPVKKQKLTTDNFLNKELIDSST